MLIGGLDVGTTGCKLTTYNEKGEFVYNSYKEYNVSRINGTHEIDAEMIFSAVCDIIKDTASKYSELDAIGVTSFGESFVLLDKDDRALLNSMLYTDPRGSEEIIYLCKNIGENKLIHISGTKPHPMYSLPKIMWIKNNLPAVFENTRRILLMEDYIVYMLTGNAQIDYSLAARTMGFDIRNKCWSNEIFAAAGLDQTLMSKPVRTGSLAGNIRKEVRENLGLSGDIMIINGSHDQVAAAIGAGILAPGEAVDGTGTVECVTPMFDKIPENAELYNEGYSVVPYVFDGTYVCYALSFTGGAALKWFRDNFAKYENEIARQSGKNVYAQLDSLIKDEPTDILILPHFSGAANPYMDKNAKALIAGLTLEHTNYDIYKALMEGVTYEVMQNIHHLENFGINFRNLYAAGGGAASDKWLQIKADIWDRPVTALDAKEAGACGTCMLACVAMGICKNLIQAKDIFVKPRKTFTPDIARAEIYKKKFEKYKNLYPMMKNVFRGETNE